MSAEAILRSVDPGELVTALLSSYTEIESNFTVRKWKASELDAGHFVEATRRIVDHRLGGTYVALGVSLPNFDDRELRRLEQTKGDESLRLLIPRVLKAVYNLRNKRGVGHLGLVSPNEMDATFILYSVKWTLGELVRLASANADPISAQRAVDGIVERKLDLIWKSGDRTRILHSGISARHQVLVLLYDSNLQSEDALRATIEYKNKSDFKKLIKKLHSDRFVEYQPEHPLAITPKGVLEAERIILEAAEGQPPLVRARKTKGVRRGGSRRST